MPPAWMWPFDEELELWFEEVESKRKAKFGGGGDDSGDDGPLMQNEFARGRR